MRKFLKKSGLTAVILVSIAAMTFLPKNVAQWFVLGSIVVFGIAKGVVYYLSNGYFALLIYYIYDLLMTFFNKHNCPPNDICSSNRIRH